MAIFRCRIFVRYLVVSLFICLGFYFWYVYLSTVLKDENLARVKYKTTESDDENEVVDVSNEKLNVGKPYLTNKVNHNVHIFYYAWYGNRVHDGKFYHWNHPILPSWKEKNNSIPLASYEPPEFVGASFYPELGAYSSKDPFVIQNHMQQLKMAGVGEWCF